MPPDLLLPLLPDRSRAAWLAPSFDLYEQQLRQRDNWRQYAALIFDDPDTGFSRLTESIRTVCEALAELALLHGGKVVRVESTEDRERLVDRVAEEIGLPA